MRRGELIQGAQNGSGTTWNSRKNWVRQTKVKGCGKGRLGVHKRKKKR